MLAGWHGGKFFLAPAFKLRGAGALQALSSHSTPAGLLYATYSEGRRFLPVLYIWSP